MNMKQVKKALALVLALVMCLGVMAACGVPSGGGQSSGGGSQGGGQSGGGQSSGGGSQGGSQPSAAPSEMPSVAPVDPTTISNFNESPYIATMGITVKVDDRLPKKDDVMVESVTANGTPLAVGKYGGDLKRSANSGNWTAGKPIEEGLFRFNSFAGIEPNVAKSYDVNADATVYTIYLREGMKWSDGEPFTAEDCVWFYNVVCMNKLDSKGIRNCHKDANGDPAKVEKVNDTTFTVTFGTPKYDFIETLTVDLKWHFAPKHYFETMCQNMIDGKDAEVIAEAKAKCGVEFADVGSVGKELLYYFWNFPGTPTLNPYVLSTEAGKNSIKGEYYEYLRNPYYWKVDTAGNQLPYIDRIIYTTTQNVSQSLMLLLDGTVDFDNVGLESIPEVLNAENVSGQKINIYEWSNVDWSSVPHQVHFNLNSENAKLKELFNKKDFRQAVSISVNRDEFAALATDSWLKGGQAAPPPGTQGYSEEWAKQWTEYDPAKAETLLQGCGLALGKDGYYDFADGTDLVINIVAMADCGAAQTYTWLKPYFEAIHLKTTFRDYDRSVLDNDLMAGKVDCIIYPVTGIGDLSIALKPNSYIPGYATNVAWYGTMNKETATGDLLKLIELKEQLDKTADTDKRTEIVNQMLKLHQENQWTLGFVEGASIYHAVNDRIKNFPDGLVWSDTLRDYGIARCQCWYID